MRGPSWNYLAEDSSAECLETAISYYMNDLQVFESPEPVVVTVNPFADIDESKILQEFSYAHPQFNMPAINAQRHLHEIKASAIGGLLVPGPAMGSTKTVCKAV